MLQFSILTSWTTSPVPDTASPNPPTHVHSLCFSFSHICHLFSLPLLVNSARRRRKRKNMHLIGKQFRWTRVGTNREGISHCLIVYQDQDRKLEMTFNKALTISLLGGSLFLLDPFSIIFFSRSVFRFFFYFSWLSLSIRRKKFKATKEKIQRSFNSEEIIE